jgi:hypothetical protein
MTKFNIGDEVKVLTQVGLMKGPKWLVGRFLDEMPENRAIVEVKGHKVVCENHKVKKYRKLIVTEDGTYPELEEFVSKYWDQLKSVVTVGVAQLLGEKAPKIEINEDDKIISADEWISIAPGVVERESFLEFAEHPSWTVSVTVSTSGSRWDPPDVDICEVGEHANVVAAAELFVNTIWKESNRGYWDSAGDYFDSQISI